MELSVFVKNLKFSQVLAMDESDAPNTVHHLRW